MKKRNNAHKKDSPEGPVAAGAEGGGKGGDEVEGAMPPGAEKPAGKRKVKKNVELSIPLPSNFTILALTLIVLTGLIGYSNTFTSPFQWDEEPLIEKNPAVSDLSYFADPSKAEGTIHHASLKYRYIGYLSFALNYKLHGFDTTGFHIANLAIHLLAAMMVFALAGLTMRTPVLANSPLRKHSRHIALFTALVFVSHPIQTEAVTYIFQRLASLAALFYLTSLAAYAMSRLSASGGKRAFFYFVSIVSAVLAMKTKENAFTLPLAVLLYEFVFFRGPVARRLGWLAPMLLTLLIIPLSLTGIRGSTGEMLGALDEATQGLGKLSRAEYFITQQRVAVTYVRLLFLPVNQNLDYYYPVYDTFFNPKILLSSLFLAALFGAALYMLRRSRNSEPALAIAAFGILWFFLTLSVESTIVPIPMVIDEYRLYLPSFGVFFAVITGLYLGAERLGKRWGEVKAQKGLLYILCALVLVLTAATFARNTVWKSRESLWSDITQKAPENVRAHYNLGTVYAKKGDHETAIKHFEKAVSLKPDFTFAHLNLGNSYLERRMLTEAVSEYMASLTLYPSYAEAHHNLGLAYSHQGLLDKAIERYNKAITLKPYYIDAHNSLGVAYIDAGEPESSIAHFLAVLNDRPDDAATHFNLGLAYNRLNRLDKAIPYYEEAVRIKHDYFEAHNNLGVAYKIKGNTKKALEHFRAVIQVNPRSAEAHFNLGLIHLKSGKIEQAMREFEAGLEIRPGETKVQRVLERLKGLGAPPPTPPTPPSLSPFP